MLWLRVGSRLVAGSWRPERDLQRADHVPGPSEPTAKARQMRHQSARDGWRQLDISLLPVVKEGFADDRDRKAQDRVCRLQCILR